MSETPRCYRHPDRETLVSCSECGRPICEECMTFAPVGIRCPDHASVAKGPRPSPVQRARHAQRSVSRSDAPATMILVGLNVLVYIITVVQGGGLSQPGGRVFEEGALVGVLVSDGEWWRLVGAMFLHASVIHLAFNMFALYWLGSIVESALGTGRYLLLYLAAGLAGSAGALLFSSPFAITVGASGAIFGLMGALLMLEYLATGSLAGQAMTLIVLNLVITFAIPNISIGGHLGGLVGGIAATFALTKLRHVRPAFLAPAAVVAIGVASLVVAYVRVENYTF
jgi:membrane associated rhomboid family serine protease